MNKLSQKNRANELCKAIQHRLDTNQAPEMEWVEELEEIVKYLQENYEF